MNNVANPLLEGDLAGAAHLCLALAAMTDRDQFPPGSGELTCRALHERRRRFEEARALMKKGAATLPELGLSRRDCSWAADMAKMAKDPEGWSSRFQVAASNLPE